MLGCQDFCGYYDWTFHYIRREHGQEALRDLWARAIGGEAQSHYETAGAAKGLLGLLETWQKTGHDEQCDWTFTLDKEKSILRWDMRRCPSKGFLLGNDLNADEDYCDHCMGWIIPLLQRIDITVTGHEHNHFGQCWGEMSLCGRPRESLDVPHDIRRDPRWNHGYLDRWRDGRKLPFADKIGPFDDPCDVLVHWFAGIDRLVVVDDETPAGRPAPRAIPSGAIVMTDAAYSKPDAYPNDPIGVLFSDRPVRLPEAAERFLGTPAEKRPLLMYTYLPSPDAPDFVSLGLPRPVPILPWLIRQGHYVHQPGGLRPSTGAFLLMLAVSLAKETDVVSLDLNGESS